MIAHHYLPRADGATQGHLDQVEAGKVLLAG